MQHFGFEAADCEGCVVVEENVEGVRGVLLVDAVLGREGRLDLRDELADPMEGRGWSCSWSVD